MIKLNDVSKEYGGRILFDEVNFSINAGERIGLIGRNGSGKSTLLKLFVNEISADSGTIHTPNNYKVSMLNQYIKFSEETVLAECCLSLSEQEQYDDYKAQKILSGLGFSETDMLKNPNDFSGGYQIRINLAKCLLERPDLLLLDEPTNYLDIVSMRWLKNFLISYPAELILITHDRLFMNEVCTHTVGIHRQKLKKIKGSTETYKLKVAEEELVHEKSRINQEKKVKEIEAFVNRFRAKASKASMVSSRVKMLEKMKEYEQLADSASMNFRFNYKPFSAKKILSASDLEFGYSKENILFKNLSFDVLKKERIGIVGKNGKGKSTLLNLLSHDLTPLSGSIDFHPSVETGFFGQTNISRLSPDNTIAQEIGSVSSALTTTEVRNICGTMMFSGDDATKKISVLSGGEKSRVLLGKILTKDCNLLLLDEPTNHLDQESVEAMTEQLLLFEGSLLFVTHSEWLLRKLATKLIVFHEDNAQIFHGSYDDFLEKIGWDNEEDIKIVKKKNKLSTKEVKKLRAQLVAEKSKTLKPLIAKRDELEAGIIKAEDELKVSQEKIIEFVKLEKSSKIQEISKMINELQIFIETNFEKLEKIEDKIGQSDKEFQDRLGLLI